MSDDLVKRAREVLNGVTPGPWEAALERGCHGIIAQSLPQGGANFVAMVGNDTDTPEKEPSRFANARFIAASRELVPVMADRIEELEAKLAKAVEALSSTRRADDLREAYHRLPNDKNRIGDKKSKKSRARDVWLRAFRKAAKEARAVLRSTEASHD